MAVKFNPKKCIKHQTCPAAAACPMQALVQKKSGDYPNVDEEKCVSCGLCVSLCPNGALSLE